MAHPALQPVQAKVDQILERHQLGVHGRCLCGTVLPGHIEYRQHVMRAIVERLQGELPFTPAPDRPPLAACGPCRRGECRSCRASRGDYCTCPHGPAERPNGSAWGAVIRRLVGA